MIGKLTKKIFINGTIVVKTGLAVGGGSIGLEIGGADKVVVRNPINNEPYIPGSSLKGKMRSLLEKLDCKFTTKTDNNGKVSTMPCSCGTCMICNIYDDDVESDMLNKIFEGLSLVQDDYLGGSGTRGYGQVKFNIKE